MFCDNLTEGAMVQLIHTLSENGFSVNDEPFLRDIGFIIEAVRGMLYRELGINHPMAKIMEVFTKTKEIKDEEGENEAIDLSHYQLKDDVMNDLLERFDNGEEEDPKDPA